MSGFARLPVALLCLLAAGCLGVDRSRPKSAPTPSDPPHARLPPVPPPAVEPLHPETPAATAAPHAPAPGTSASTKQVNPAKPPATASVMPAPAPPITKPTMPAVASKPTPPPLDLSSLEARLRDTKAIGVFTKISLKTQVDDLLNKFRAYYKRQTKATLAELRRPYDMLLLKVLSLLQDSDPPLARDIVASREAIWGILADPEKFNEAKLMAGESP